MNENMETVSCGLCFNITSHSKCGMLQETLVMLEMLNIPNLNLNKGEDPLICSICVKQVKSAFDFKVACLKGENSRISKLTQMIDKVLCKNLVECRLCDNCLSKNSAVLLLETLKENDMMGAFQKCIPEINLDATENPIICEPCQTLLSSFSNFVFLLSSTDAQPEENGFYQLFNMEDPIRLESDDLKVIKDKTEITSTNSSCEDINKSGAVEVKIEIIKESESNTRVAKIEEDILENKNHSVQIKIETVTDTAYSEGTSLGIKVDNEALNEYDSTDDGNRILKVDMKKTLSNEYTEHQLKQEEIDIKLEPEQDMSERNGTDGIMKQKTHLKDKMLIYELDYQKCNDKILSKGTKLKMYSCQQCSYDTYVKHHIQQHLLIHKSSDEVEMHMCSQCSYQTKYKSALTRHTLIHKNSDDVETHKCSQCSYQSKFKDNFTKHLITHKKIMYECQSCTFQTKFKHYLKKHLLIHKHFDDAEMQKCPQCNYQSKFKQNLKNHMMIHKTSSEVEIYKCHHCVYRTKLKNSIKQHVLIHKSSDNVEMYKCSECSYQTKFKHRVKIHMMIHKNTDEMHKCHNCTYQTKYKYNIKRHMVTHKKLVT